MRALQFLILTATTFVPATASALYFRWPVYEGAGVNFYVDHAKNGKYVIYTCDPSKYAEVSTTRHKGTDINVDGAPVHAAADGWVMYLESGHDDEPDKQGFGNHVVLLHAGGFATIYGHLRGKESFAFPEFGQRVSCGEQIGMSGNSGFSTGPHLHFEIRDGVPTVCTLAEGRAHYNDGITIDPFSGPCSGEVYWSDQNWGSPRAACTTTNSPPPPTPAEYCSGQVPSGWPGDHSALASEEVPDGTLIATGLTFVKTLVIKNTGSTTWTSDYSLRLVDEGGNPLQAVSAPIDGGETVKPQQLKTWFLLLKTPATPGRYKATWRMYRKQGGAGAYFGESFWADVNVRAFNGKGCYSNVVGKEVRDGDYVQSQYGGCGVGSCAWHICDAGTLRCGEPIVVAPFQKEYANAACPAGGGGGGINPNPPGSGAGCYSQTLQQTVPSGDCIQVSYVGCGMAKCGWYGCMDGAWQCTAGQSCLGATHANAACGGGGMPGVCGCASGYDNFCDYPPGTAACPMTWPGGYCDPNGDGSYTDGDWIQGYSNYQGKCAGAGGSGSGSSGATTGSGGAGSGSSSSSGAGGGGSCPSIGSCGCKQGVDNFCSYGVNVLGCPMTAPGGYCDPNGNGDFSDDGGDNWVTGYNEYYAACTNNGCRGLSCGDLADYNGWVNEKCEWSGNGACGGYGTPTYDCDYCCP